MSLFDLFHRNKISAEHVGRCAIVLNNADVNAATHLIAAIEAKFGPVVLLLAQPYAGAHAHYRFDAKNAAPVLRGLSPQRIVVVGEIDARLFRTQQAPLYWLNASRTPEAATRAITVASQRQADAIEHAVITGDPLLDIATSPGVAAPSEFCERFKEFSERQRWVGYFAATGDGEEDAAYLTFMQLSRKNMGILVLAPHDPARYEPVYRDAIKYRLPTNRHARLITSYIPHKTRVYYIEDATALHAMYACADFVVVGGTLSASAAHAPDVLTPLQMGKAAIVGPQRQDRLVHAALAADVLMAADDVNGIVDAAQRLIAEPNLRAQYVARASTWLQIQERAVENVMQVIE